MTPLLFVLVSTQIPEPPVTLRRPVTETVHGVKISDPYRWLEDQTSPATRKWITEQNRYSDRLLRPIPGRIGLRNDLERFSRIDSYSFSFERNDRIFFSRRKPTDEQAVLYWRDGLNGKDQVFIDPQPLSKDRSTTAQYLDASADGRYVVYQIRKGGQDEVNVFVRDMRTGKDLADSLPLGDYWSVSITPDGKAIYYSLHRNLVGSRIRMHRMGTAHRSDVEIYGKQYKAEISTTGWVTEDGRYLIMGVAQGWDRNEIYAKDLKEDGPVFPIVTGMDAVYMPAYAEGKLYVQTDLDAPRRRIVEIDPKAPARENWRTVVPEGTESIESSSLVNGSLFVQRLHNVASRISRYSLSGEKLGDIALPGPGAATVPSGRWKGKVAFFDFTSFTTPRTVYRWSGGKTAVWAQSKLQGYDPNRYSVRQVFAKSKDGTMVPAFVVYRKGLSMDGKRPTLIFGYGGFNASMTPSFSNLATAWFDRGGVFVSVALRGGGEYGEAWHRAGMLANKQNVFDDLYATTEHLFRQGVTSRNHVAVLGGSNGGLLVGAAVTQRPDLYRAAVCAVPLLDMVRYERFLQGPQWSPEYGSAKDPEAFKWLYGYSPYHHVKKGTKYPAILFLTGDGDTRVAPLHARKMTALMQWATGGDRPILLHYETKSGHSGGESVTKAADNNSLMLAFLAQQLGLPLRGKR